MIQTIRNAWRVPELKKKMLFTIMALLIEASGRPRSPRGRRRRNGPTGPCDPGRRSCRCRSRRPGPCGSNGELSKKLIVKASAFSASAKEKIVAAGGKWEVV